MKGAEDRENNIIGGVDAARLETAAYESHITSNMHNIVQVICDSEDLKEIGAFRVAADN